MRMLALALAASTVALSGAAYAADGGPERTLGTRGSIYAVARESQHPNDRSYQDRVSNGSVAASADGTSHVPGTRGSVYAVARDSETGMDRVQEGRSAADEATAPRLSVESAIQQSLYSVPSGRRGNVNDLTYGVDGPLNR
jgi:hypothetical protein